MTPPRRRLLADDDAFKTIVPSLRECDRNARHERARDQQDGYDRRRALLVVRGCHILLLLSHTARHFKSIARRFM